ncbi:Hpt domain-containing protein [Zoogloea sp.]|uniref:Hpt domain-containing protein n=1 Tax=Zoogloea sp. TaxID=49181 RepID=UPI0026032180|nr:Hpt domain-containing protein [Zoogloea sp.]MDD3352846.1 Hpt domain-containing protein [Zoogloea sp.]
MIHWNELEARYPGKTEFVRKLLQLFADSQSGLPEQLRAGVENGDLIHLARLAHGLKSSAGNVMDLVLMEAARQAEQLARAEDPAAFDAALDLADQLTDTLAGIRTRLEA